MNGIVFLVLFLDCSSLVYRNKTDFCVWILCLTTLCLVHVSVCVSVSSIYRIMSSISKVNFASSLPIGMLLFPFLADGTPLGICLCTSERCDHSASASHWLLLLQPEIHAEVASHAHSHPQKSGGVAGFAPWLHRLLALWPRESC